ncbi:MAG: hypothetical protein KC486_28940 [Myxococcales bacterium]|nr:hypothetical protein [Myxococcales bacterium]
MSWSQETIDIMTTVLRNSMTVGRVVAFDVDVDAVHEDALPQDAAIEAVLYRRDEGADARLDGAITQRGTITRVDGGDDEDTHRSYRVLFDAPPTGDYQVVLHWPNADDDRGTYHYEALALPGSDDGLLRIR